MIVDESLIRLHREAEETKQTHNPPAASPWAA